MNKVFVLARNTFFEMLHERLFFVVVIIAVFLISFSFLLGALSFDEQKKILADFGFLAIQVASLGIALFSGAYLIHREIEKQTCLLMLARPLSRGQFFIGKFLGLLALNTVLIFSLAGVLYFILGPPSEQTISFVKIVLSLWFESAVVLAFVLTAAMIVRPILALALGFAVFLTGHWLADLLFFAEKSKDEMNVRLVQFLGWIVPNFYRMNWKSFFFLQDGIPNTDLLWMMGHCTGWMILLLLLGQRFFGRKDIV